MTTTTAIPTNEEKEDMLLSCRYGDLDEVKQFVQTFGAVHISDIRDENNNTVLHMLAGNGHTGLYSALT